MPAGAGYDPVGWFVRRAGLARFTTVACTLGLSLAAAAGASPTVALAGLTVALAGDILGLACRGSRRWSWLLLVSVLLTGLFGGFLGGSVRVAELRGGHLGERIGESVKAELVITGSVRSHSGWQSATAVVTALGGAPAGAPDAHPPSGVGETVLLEVAPPAAGSQEGSSGQAAAVPTLSQGMIVAFDGAIEAPQGPSDSGYDQAKQLLHQGIEVVFQADGAGSIGVLGRRGGVAGWFDRLRASARDHLARGPDARTNEALQGVVLGDTAGIDEGWMEAFRRSGTAHMLSVSGLHVGSIAAIMIGLARLLGAARWVGFLAAALSAVLMVPFVGASPPIVRSAIMIVIVLTGRWVGRGRDQWQILALAAAVILALNPFALFDVGFQLSFAAFAGMLALTAPLQRALRRLPKGVAANVAVSIAATVGTAPVSLAVFGRTSLVAPLANLLVVPMLPFVTGLGMAAVFLGFVWTGLSAALDTLASLPMIWTVLVSELMALAPVLGTADLGRALAALVAGAIVLPAALTLTGRAVRPPFSMPLPFFRRSVAWLGHHRPRSRRRAVALATAVAVAGLFVGGAAYPAAVGAFEALQIFGAARDWPDHVEVRVLDIGQGNAVLVRTPEHHAVLFDGGPSGCGLAGQLRDLGVKELDLVVISHPHADHFAGLLEALATVEVTTLVDQVAVVAPDQAGSATSSSSSFEASAGREAADYLELRRELAEDGCRYVPAATGGTAQVDGVTIRFFAPARPLVLVDGPAPWTVRGGAPTGDELNGASVVAVVSVGEIDVLIPGDAEAQVLDRYDLPPVEVVVVPHHGSRGAVSAALLEALQTQAALISVGEGNSFGHPDPGTVAVLENAAVTVLRTDTAGWVCCRVNDDTVVITTERKPVR